MFPTLFKVTCPVYLKSFMRIQLTDPIRIKDQWVKVLMLQRHRSNEVILGPPPPSSLALACEPGRSSVLEPARCWNPKQTCHGIVQDLEKKKYVPTRISKKNLSEKNDQNDLSPNSNSLNGFFQNTHLSAAARYMTVLEPQEAWPRVPAWWWRHPRPKERGIWPKVRSHPCGVSMVLMMPEVWFCNDLSWFFMLFDVW